MFRNIVYRSRNATIKNTVQLTEVVKALEIATHDVWHIRYSNSPKPVLEIANSLGICILFKFCRTFFIMYLGLVIIKGS